MNFRLLPRTIGRLVNRIWRHPGQRHLGPWGPGRAWRWHPWYPTLISTTLVLGLTQFGISPHLESAASDVLFRSRGHQAWDERLVIINIDQRSLEALGWFPWRRDRYAALLNRLSDAAQNTVVFDLIFSEPAPEDAGFEAVMGRHHWVVLGSTWTAAHTLWEPTPKLRQAATAVGHIAYQRADFDPHLIQIVPFYPRPQTTPQQPNQQREAVPALAIAALQAHALGGSPLPEMPLDQTVTINWPGPIGNLPHYSFVDIVQGKVNLQNFDHKIILVGATAPGMDQISLPLEWLADAHGVHIHAAAIHNALHQNALRLFPVADMPGLILLVGVAWGIGVSWLKANRQLWAMALGPLAWLCCTWVAFIGNYRLPVGLPVLLMVSISVGVLWQERLRLAQTNQQLNDQMTVDVVTQIKNRYFLEQALGQLWRRLGRHHGKISLIIGDIDYFKRYNDTYGHPAGDRCLYEVAQTIQACLRRPEDFVARYGGEEFVVVLPDTPLDGAIHLAEQLQAALSRLAIAHPEAPGVVTMSFGVAAGQVGDHSATTLLQQADRALYNAKHLGRNRYAVAEHDHLSGH